MAVLKLTDVETCYGGIRALKGMSIEVSEGAVVAVIGANGAGKSTTLKTISGITPPSRGTIEFLGKRIDRLPPEQIVRLGISQVPEGRQIFSDLTVLENLRMGAYGRTDKRNVAADYERMFEYFPVLKSRRSQIAGTMSGGEQQMLAIARGLMARPRLLMIDEMSLGLAPIITRDLFNMVRRMNEQGITILLVEQNASLALSFAKYGYVLETGRVALADEAEHLLRSEHVRRLYLGG